MDASVTSGTRREYSRLAFLGWVGFALLFAYAVLVGGNLAGTALTTFRVFALALIVSALVVWALLAWRDPWWRPRTAIWPALVVPLAAFTLAILASPFPRLGLDYLPWFVLLIALYLLLQRVAASDMARRQIGALMMALSLGVSGLYVALVFGHWMEWWQLIGRFSVPMLRPAYTQTLIGGPTIMAPVIVLLWVSAITGIGTSTRGRRVLVVVSSLLALVAVILSGTRGAWLGLAAGLFVVGLALVVQQRARLRALVPTRRAYGFGLGLLVLGVGVLVVLGPLVLERLTSTGDGGRVYYLETALRMFRAAPLLGQGPGNWAARRLSFSEAGEPDIYVPHPHNVYALTLAESGVVGIAAGAVALLAVAWLVLTGLRSGDPWRLRWSLASLFVLVYLAVASLVDSFANLPVVIILAAVPFAFLDAASPSGITDRFAPKGTLAARRRIAQAFTLAVFAIALAAIVGLVRIESISFEHDRAVNAIEQGDYQTAYEHASVAVGSDPAMVPYQVTYGLASAATDDLASAAKAFERAAATDDLPQSWIDLAHVRERAAAPTAEVGDAIEQGLRVGSQHPSVAIAAAELYARIGRVADAQETLTNLFVQVPSLVADPAWPEHALFGDIYPAAVRDAVERADDPWELLLMLGDEAGATRAAGSGQNPLRETVTAAWFGDLAALETLRGAVLQAPTDQWRSNWAARVFARQGDHETATQMRRLTAFTYEGRGGPPGYEMRLAISGERGPAGAVPVAAIYGANDYRRFTPAELLVPGLPIVVPVDLSDPAATEPVDAEPH